MDWTAIGPHGQALLKGERAFRAGTFQSIKPEQLEFEAAWRNYMLLETFDYLSLLTCFGFESTGCGPVPTSEGQWEQLSVRRLGPWEVELAPFPFPGDTVEIEVESVYLESARFRSDDELQALLNSGRREPRRTVYAGRS